MAYVRGFGGGGGYFSCVISMCVCLPCFRLPGGLCASEVVKNESII